MDDTDSLFMFLCQSLNDWIGNAVIASEHNWDIAGINHICVFFPNLIKSKIIISVFGCHITVVTAGHGVKNINIPFRQITGVANRYFTNSLRCQFTGRKTSDRATAFPRYTQYRKIIFFEFFFIFDSRSVKFIPEQFQLHSRKMCIHPGHSIRRWGYFKKYTEKGGFLCPRAGKSGYGSRNKNIKLPRTCING